VINDANFLKRGGMQRLTQSVKKTKKDMKACLQLAYVPLIPFMELEIADGEPIPYGHLRLRDIHIKKVVKSQFKSDMSHAHNSPGKGIIILVWGVGVPVLFAIETAMFLPVAVVSTTGRFVLGVLDGAYSGLSDLVKMMAREIESIHAGSAPEVTISNSQFTIMKNLDVETQEPALHFEKDSFESEHEMPDRKANNQIKSFIDIDMIKNERRFSEVQLDASDSDCVLDIDSASVSSQLVFR